MFSGEFHTKNFCLPGKRLCNDGLSTEEPGLQGSVFSGGALAVVLIADNDPADTWSHMEYIIRNLPQMIKITVALEGTQVMLTKTLEP